MRPKYYICNEKNKKNDPKGRGRKYDPNSWCTGPDELKHEKYYAFLKHRSQAKYRCEPHDLTFEDWLEFWTDENYSQRGRSRDSLILAMSDPELGWTKSNLYITDRLTHLREQKGKQDD